MSKLADNRPHMQAPEHSVHGGSRPEATPTLAGRPGSSIPIQKIINNHCLDRSYDRGSVREGDNSDDMLELAEELAAFLDKQSLCYREYHVESAMSGKVSGRSRLTSTLGFISSAANDPVSTT